MPLHKRWLVGTPPSIPPPTGTIVSRTATIDCTSNTAWQASAPRFGRAFLWATCSLICWPWVGTKSRWWSATTCLPVLHGPIPCPRAPYNGTIVFCNWTSCPPSFCPYGRYWSVVLVMEKHRNKWWLWMVALFSLFVWFVSYPCPLYCTSIGRRIDTRCKTMRETPRCTWLLSSSSFTPWCNAFGLMAWSTLHGLYWAVARTPTWRRNRHSTGTCRHAVKHVTGYSGTTSSTQYKCVCTTDTHTHSYHGTWMPYTRVHVKHV